MQPRMQRSIARTCKSRAKREIKQNCCNRAEGFPLPSVDCGQTDIQSTMPLLVTDGLRIELDCC